MKISFINTLYGELTSSPPLGIAYIASYLRNNGYATQIVDRVPFYYKNKNNLRATDELTIKAIIDFKPEMIGITMMTSQLNDARHIIKLLCSTNEVKKSNIIVGGFHPSAEPESTLKDLPWVDLAVIGEGELTMLDIAKGKPFKSIPGIIYRKNDNLITTGHRERIHKLDELPFPARDLLDINFYCAKRGDVIGLIYAKVITMITSRGCPGRCKFCASNLIHRPVRFHSAEYVIKEIEELLSTYKFEAISFVDTMFLGDKTRTVQLCELIMERKINKRIKWAANVRADFVEENILNLMKKAGCFYLLFGFESGSDKLLKSIRKNITVEQNIKAAQLAKKLGILIHADMILGLPEETEDDFKLTVEFLKKIKPFTISLNIFVPLPGCEFYNEFKEKGILTNGHFSFEEVARVSKEGKIYSKIPRERFLYLYDQLQTQFVRPLINKNYIKANWKSDPITLLRVIKNRPYKFWIFIKNLIKKMFNKDKEIKLWIMN